MTIEAILFDFDGLLMDTESSMLASWQGEWRHHGLELELETFWVNHGGDVTEQRYDLLAQAVGPSFNRAERHARRVATRDRLHADLQFCEGIQGWLARAVDLRLRVAICWRSPREDAGRPRERASPVSLRKTEDRHASDPEWRPGERGSRHD